MAGLDGIHVVAVGSPVARRAQERARAVTLRRLVIELYARSVGQLWIESRQRGLDRRDVQVVVAARHDIPPGSGPPIVDHCRGPDEPLLWVADIVAGAARAHRQGEAAFVEILGRRIEVIDVDI